ncbi:S8 family serine peptidase [Crossiella sp. SN42]|uniref:S8 family serine peptidase n=1 Tax=Crossiella sp. SN42 TaxID=2944808 RepID=UPI00207CB6EB|nr:S8 family serine peptidase [Crossiella sp. SN42]MCO1578821.1 S8 family serine peptidase [Crossiella sp. SN42]
MRRRSRVFLVAITASSLVLSAGAMSANGAAEDEQVRMVGADKFTISLDGGRTWSRELPQASQIRLANRSFDPVTQAQAETATPEDLRARQGGAYLVQFKAAPLDAQRRELARLGARVGAFIPDYAYVVRMSPATKERVAKLGYVRWVGAYQPGDKLAPAAIAETKTARYVVTLVEADAAGQRDAAEAITRAGGQVHVVSQSAQHLEATLSPQQLRATAHLDQVLAVDAASAPETDMDNARIDGGANTIEAAGGYKGQGVVGEVMDSGLRTTHQEFRAKPPIIHGAAGTSPSHGTATYGQIFATGVSPKHRGLLPEGQGIHAGYGVADRYAHSKELVDPNGKYKAVFQTNSWGNALTTSYTTISAAMDKIVFDLDLFICQSQSNAGSRQSRPEAWAKNVLSVGAQYHKNTLSRTDDTWNRGASIGPAADGRIKPEISNYYDAIDTTTSTSDTAYTPSFGGTSGATPITCGNAGLVFQMWADGVFDGAPGKKRDVFASRPHAATVKALLVNTANQYAFTGENHDLTRVHQGWGTASVGNLYNQAKGNSWKLPLLVNETDLLKAGASKAYTVEADGSTPFKATLAYTDPAGSPTAAVSRVNDLTLKVTAPDGTVYWGNNGLTAGNYSTPGGSPNAVDTVENVILEKAAKGTWKVEVLADQVNADGHPETPETDADYALVVTK